MLKASLSMRFLMGSTYELPTLDDLDRHPLISGLLALHMQVLAQ